MQIGRREGRAPPADFYVVKWKGGCWKLGKRGAGSCDSENRGEGAQGIGSVGCWDELWTLRQTRMGPKARRLGEVEMLEGGPGGSQGVCGVRSRPDTGVLESGILATEPLLMLKGEWSGVRSLET